MDSAGKGQRYLERFGGQLQHFFIADRFARAVITIELRPSQSFAAERERETGGPRPSIAHRWADLNSMEELAC